MARIIEPATTTVETAHTGSRDHYHSLTWLWLIWISFWLVYNIVDTDKRIKRLEHPDAGVGQTEVMQ